MRPRSPLPIAAPCACGRPTSVHVCLSCGLTRDHADLLRVVAGFTCRPACEPPAVRRVPGKPW